MSVQKATHVDVELVEILRAEYASASGHAFVDSAALGHLTQHDRRMTDGSCLTCMLLRLVDVAIRPEPEPQVVAGDVTDPARRLLGELQHYEEVHGQHVDGWPCLGTALDEARKAVSG